MAESLLWHSASPWVGLIVSLSRLLPFITFTVLILIRTHTVTHTDAGWAELQVKPRWQRIRPKLPPQMSLQPPSKLRRLQKPKRVQQGALYMLKTFPSRRTDRSILPDSRSSSFRKRPTCSECSTSQNTQISPRSRWMLALHDGRQEVRAKRLRVRHTCGEEEQTPRKQCDNIKQLFVFSVSVAEQTYFCGTLKCDELWKQGEGRTLR